MTLLLASVGAVSSEALSSHGGPVEGVALELDVSPHSALLVVVDSAEPVYASLYTTWRFDDDWNLRMAEVALAGADFHALEPAPGFLIWNFDWTGARFAASTPTGSLVLPPHQLVRNDSEFSFSTWEGVRFGPGGVRIVLLGYDSAHSRGGNATLTVPAGVDVSAFEVPIVFLDDHDWPALVAATAKAGPSGRWGATLLTVHEENVEGSLYAYFSGHASLGVSATWVEGPDRSHANEPRYRILGGPPGRWEFGALFGAGGGYEATFIAVDVPTLESPRDPGAHTAGASREVGFS